MERIIGMYLVFVVLAVVMTFLTAKLTLWITKIEIEYSYGDEVVLILYRLWKIVLIIMFFLGLLLIYKGD